MFRKILIAAAAVAALSASAQAAPQTYSLTIDKDHLAGPGADVLKQKLQGAQFILWGEDHGYADSAIVLRALAHDAQPLGFAYHAVEVGPLSLNIFREAVKKEGIAGMRKIVHGAPLAFPFLSLKDDAELASDYLGSDAKGTPYLWGMDQEFIGSPVLHLKRLTQIAPNDAARAEAQRLLAIETDAAATGQQQKFLLSSMDDKGFASLADLFKGQAESERIVAELRESAAIYQLWMSGHNYENNARRARWLAHNFLENYRKAAASAPKVVFKMGLEHVALGTTTINTVDLGTLVSSLARSNDMTALRIAFLPAGGSHLALAPKPGNPTTVAPYDSAETDDLLKAIGLDKAQLSKSGWTLVPLEPIRQQLDTQGIEKLSSFSRFILLGYDYLVTTPEAKPGTFLY